MMIVKCTKYETITEKKRDILDNRVDINRKIPLADVLVF